MLHSIIPALTALWNASLIPGVFPEGLTCAQVTPLLKKTGLDVTNFNNYHLASNISFLSKVIEKVIAQQLNTHLSRNGLHDTIQPAYKQDSSTETALICIKVDMEEVLDKGYGELLVVLDLSVAPWTM